MREMRAFTDILNEKMKDFNTYILTKTNNERCAIKEQYPYLGKFAIEDRKIVVVCRSGKYLERYPGPDLVFKKEELKAYLKDKIDDKILEHLKEETHTRLCYFFFDWDTIRPILKTTREEKIRDRSRRFVEYLKSRILINGQMMTSYANHYEKQKLSGRRKDDNDGEFANQFIDLMDQANHQWQTLSQDSKKTVRSLLSDTKTDFVSCGNR